jgi:hypothetical protein
VQSETSVKSAKSAKSAKRVIPKRLAETTINDESESGIVTEEIIEDKELEYKQHSANDTVCKIFFGKNWRIINI